MSDQTTLIAAQWNKQWDDSSRAALLTALEGNWGKSTLNGNTKVVYLGRLTWWQVNASGSSTFSIPSSPYSYMATATSADGTVKAVEVRDGLTQLSYSGGNQHWQVQGGFRRDG